MLRNAGSLMTPVAKTTKQEKRNKKQQKRQFCAQKHKQQDGLIIHYLFFDSRAQAQKAYVAPEGQGTNPRDGGPGDQGTSKPRDEGTNMFYLMRISKLLVLLFLWRLFFFLMPITFS